MTLRSILFQQTPSTFVSFGRRVLTAIVIGTGSLAAMGVANAAVLPEPPCDVDYLVGVSTDTGSDDPATATYEAAEADLTAAGTEFTANTGIEVEGPLGHPRSGRVMHQRVIVLAHDAGQDSDGQRALFEAAIEGREYDHRVEGWSPLTPGCLQYGPEGAGRVEHRITVVFDTAPDAAGEQRTDTAVSDWVAEHGWTLLGVTTTQEFRHGTWQRGYRIDDVDPAVTDDDLAALDQTTGPEVDIAYLGDGPFTFEGPVYPLPEPTATAPADAAPPGSEAAPNAGPPAEPQLPRTGAPAGALALLAAATLLLGVAATRTSRRRTATR